jgi:hypothetical protein
MVDDRYMICNGTFAVCTNQEANIKLDIISSLEYMNITFYLIVDVVFTI